MLNVAKKNSFILVVTMCVAHLVGMPVFAIAGEHQQGVDHSVHMQMLEKKSYDRKMQVYPIPDVVLVDQNNEQVALLELLQDDDPVMLNFIYTSCTTICPILTAGFANMQSVLGSSGEKNVRMVSISIDPEYDTPAKLSGYAKRYNAEKGWLFLTGEQSEILEVLYAFDAYRGEKMNHVPLTFIRARPEEAWVRMEGFPSGSDMMKEYRSLVSANEAQ